jgi:hypothetical protein
MISGTAQAEDVQATVWIAPRLRYNELRLPSTQAVILSRRMARKYVPARRKSPYPRRTVTVTDSLGGAGR